jgi:hypothetical protein
MDFKEIRWEDVDFSGSGLGQLVGPCELIMNLQVPYNAGNFFTVCGIMSF